MREFLPGSVTGSVTFLVSDHLGSQVMTLNEDGTWQSSLRYSAYGELRGSWGSHSIEFRYTGQLSIEGTPGLYACNAAGTFRPSRTSPRLIASCLTWEILRTGIAMRMPAIILSGTPIAAVITATD
jgi:hypothetical protein